MFGVFSSATQVATRLVTVPIVVLHLGLGGYGIWNIIMTTATYMRFGSVGVKTAFQKYVAEATGNHNYETASKLLSTGFAIMLALSIVGLIPLFLYSHHIARAAGVPLQFLDSAAGAISLLAAIMLLSNVGATYEAIVMGAHRIDLVRKFGTVLTILEALGIVTVLHFGYGLFAMAAVMGSSELVYIVLCYIAARRVLPQIRVSRKFVSFSVVYELFRFAGSYQVLNLLEVLYVSILPFAILRSFGATESGVYAIITRVVGSAAMIQEAFLPSILSGGAMVFASGSNERLKFLLSKSFKATMGLSILPLGFIALFGNLMAYAWTGQSDSSFTIAFCLICLTSLFKAFSLLAVVLYRTSGKAVLDNLRQIIRIAIILCVVWFSPLLGFYGVLTGLATAEFAGMVFMIFALANAFPIFDAKVLISDFCRFLATAAIVLAAGWLAGHVPSPFDFGGRGQATFKLLEIGTGCLLAAWPTMLLTGSLTRSERNRLLDSIRSAKPSVVV